MTLAALFFPQYGAPVQRTRSIEAIALLEIDGLPRATLAHDAALKRAEIEVLAHAPTSPGKIIFVFGGAVAETEEARQAALSVVGERLIDQLFLPGVHPDVVAALLGEKRSPNEQALGILECTSVAATLKAADAAVKTTDVLIGELHAASGFGGRGYFTLIGEQSAVEAAVLAASSAAGTFLSDQQVIANPHDELQKTVLKRPWSIDPAR